MTKRNQSFWTEHEDKILIRLWRQAMPTSIIGQRLIRNKNMVIGRAHRLKLGKHPSLQREETYYEQYKSF
jgi:hypothetical protein